MIAVDAMGGDHAPRAVVYGAYEAAKSGIPVQLFGDTAQIEPLLINIDTSWDSLPISLEHCSEEIAMGAEPGKSVLKKKDASLVRAVQAVADGKAQAVVSAGNSGAALVAGTLILGRAQGILRPALGDFLPTKKGSIFCIDLGANVDAKPEFLEQFAVMGHVYVNMFKHIADPRIALLSNGHEAYKGSDAVKKAYERLHTSTLNFVGNLEPRDMFDDSADVLVCDGFVGNVLLKSIQGTAKAMTHWLTKSSSITWWQKLLLALNASIFKSLKKKIDYSKKGGALLLGLRHPLIIAHGCSNDVAVEHAIKFAYTTVQDQVIPRFNTEVALLIKQHLGVPGTVARTLRSIFKSKRV